MPEFYEKCRDCERGGTTVELRGETKSRYKIVVVINQKQNYDKQEIIKR